MTQANQLALAFDDSAAPSPPALTVVAVPPVAPAEPLPLADRVNAWLLEQRQLGTAPVKFYHLCDAFPDETASDLDTAAYPFERGHDSGPNTYEAK